MNSVKRALVLLGSLTLVACKGGGAGGEPPPPPAVTYDYYTGSPTATSAVGGLFSVSSAAPATPATVDVNALANYGSSLFETRNTRVAAGTMDGVAGTLSNVRSYAVVFSANGRLWKQYADRAPAPVQISNVAAITAGLGNGAAGASATDLCSMTTDMHDFANPENTIVIYSLAGANATCGDGDDTHYWLRLDASTTTAPTVLSVRPIAPVYSNTGAVTNVIALNGSGALVKLDANFGSPTTIAAGPFTDIEWLTPLSPTRMLVLVSNGTAGELRIVDASANTLTAVLGNIGNAAAWSETYVYDASNVYFVGNDGAGTPAGVIQRFPVNGSTAATPFFDAGAVQIDDLYLSATSVIYSARDGTGGEEIASVPKGGSAKLSLATSAAGEGLILFGVSSAGFVYYDRYSVATPSAGRAEAKKDNGASPVSHGAPNGGEWVGFQFATTYNIFTSEIGNIDQLVVAEYAAGAADLSGATLSVVNAGTAAKNGTVVGTVPAGISYIFGGGLGSRSLWYAYDGDTEIFYVDTAVAGSLTRVTNDTVGQQFVY